MGVFHIPHYQFYSTKRLHIEYCHKHYKHCAGLDSATILLAYASIYNYANVNLHLGAQMRVELHFL